MKTYLILTNIFFSLKAECGQNQFARIVKLNQPVKSDRPETDPLGMDSTTPEETLSDDDSMFEISTPQVILSDWNSFNLVPHWNNFRK